MIITTGKIRIKTKIKIRTGIKIKTAVRTTNHREKEKDCNSLNGTPRVLGGAAEAAPPGRRQSAVRSVQQAVNRHAC